MKAYFAAFRMRWKMETQYRAAALGGILCQVFFGLILVAVYRALYQNKAQTLPLESVVAYVWLQQAFFRMLLSSDDELTSKIRTGTIAYDLCRPLNAYGYYYSRILAQKLLGSLLRAGPMLVIAALLPSGWGLCAPASLSSLGLALLGLMLGLFCVCALENITMGLTLRTIDAKGVQALLNLTMMTFSGNILPLTLFPDRWQKAITLLPYAQLLDAPIRLYTGEWSLHQAPQALLVQLFWTIALIGLGLLIWKRNEKRIVVQGG